MKYAQELVGLLKKKSPKNHSDPFSLTVILRVRGGRLGASGAVVKKILFRSRSLACTASEDGALQPALRETHL